MSFFKKESFENNKGWTAAAIVVGAGVIGYVGYKYYKDNLKGGKQLKRTQDEEITFKENQKDSSFSKSFDKLEDLSKKTNSEESFIVLPRDLSNLPDPAKQLENVSEKISEGTKQVVDKLDNIKQNVNKDIDAGVKAATKTIEGYSQDVNKGVKEATEKIKETYKEADEKLKDGVKQAAGAVEDFKSAAHDTINDVSKKTSDTLQNITDETHKKLEEGAADISKNL